MKSLKNMRETGEKKDWEVKELKDNVNVLNRVRNKKTEI